MRIGLYGGSFNPIHEGHLAAAMGACDALDLEKLIFIPSGHPPLKGNMGLVDGAHRVAMIELAVANDPRMDVSAVEIERRGPSFTIDTVCTLRERFPSDAQLFFLLGDDCLDRLPHWKGIDALRAMLAFVILPRRANRTDTEDSYIRLTLPRRDISSTQIRAMFAAGETPSATLLCRDVARYINTHSLYQPVAVSAYG